MNADPVFKAVELHAGPNGFLQNLDFEIEAGEWVFVIGPNGSGKSTLLDALSGWISHQGTLLFQGQPLSLISPRVFARSVAVLRTQESPVFGFSVEEFVESGTFPHGSADSQKSARGSIELVGGLNWLHRPVTSLSSGEFQRVCLARVLAQQTPVLLLDEPTSHLDPGHHAACFELIANLRSHSPKTVISICHDLSAAAQYGDRLVLLSQGQILAQGTAREVLTAANLEAAYGCSFEFEPNPSRLQPRALANGSRSFFSSP